MIDFTSFKKLSLIIWRKGLLHHKQNSGLEWFRLFSGQMDEVKNKYINLNINFLSWFKILADNSSLELFEMWLCF